MTTMTTPAEFLSLNNERIHNELFDFLRIRSVSARSEHAADVASAAEWLREKLKKAGLESVVHQTAGHPVVLGEWRGAGREAPTILVYGHYDVQPAEPLELWDSPPFEPTIRNGRIFARGSVDDKGQLYAHVKALEAHMATRGRLPCNVIVLAEGEEEVGSDHLAEFIESKAAQLQCDGVVISDSAMFAEGVPSILSSLRGLAYFQIEVEGPSTDLHSGSYGGAVANPAMELARILGSMHDASRRVAIDGFYDRVRDCDADVRAGIRSLPFDESGFLEETGARSAAGEARYSTLERIWSRPTLEVNGLLSGYTGEGAKTVLPSRAMAKVSCRLVPDQTPEEIDRLVRAHIERVASHDVKVSVQTLHGGMPWRGKLSGPLFEAGKVALGQAFGREPVVVGEGGSIPVVHDFVRLLGAPVLLMGFGLPGENAHAPNEWISDENFVKGMRALVGFWDLLPQTRSEMGSDSN